MATIHKLTVTVPKNNLVDSYFPKVYPPFSLVVGQKVQFDDDINQLIVKIPGYPNIRRVNMSKAEVESFTKYEYE